MPHYVIHIGAHKTGTTYLQLVFQALRPALRKAGILFPALWRESEEQPGNHQLYKHLAAGEVDSLRPAFAGFAESDVTQVLLSTENLTYLPEAGVRALRSLMGNEPAKIVYYCRRWSDVLPSVWQERIKHGFSETFPRFVAEALPRAESIYFIGFANVLDRFANVFGHESIQIGSYDGIGAAETDLAVHFFQTFFPGIPALADANHGLRGTRPNSSLSPVRIEIVRALNIVHHAQTGTRGPGVREWFLRDGLRYDLSPLISAIEAHLTTERISDSTDALQRLHERIWSRYGRSVVPPCPEGRFFAPAIRDATYADPRYLSSPANQQMILALYQAYRDAPKAR